MQEKAIISVAYTGEAVNDGTMKATELAAALVALSNLISEANQILNDDGSTIEVRITSHFERGSFEMMLSLVRTLPQQIRLLFSEASYSLDQILNELGLAATLSEINLLELLRRLKGKQPEKLERINDGKARVIFEENKIEVTIGVLKLYKSEKVRKYIEEAIEPLKNDGVDSLEFRNAQNKEKREKITKEETEYFTEFAQGEGLKEKKSTQELMLRVVSVSFERGLKWRFDDGESKFYAIVKDEQFLGVIEAGRLKFGSGDVITAEVETTQQYVGIDLRKTIKAITKVHRINE